MADLIVIESNVEKKCSLCGEGFSYHDMFSVFPPQRDIPHGTATPPEAMRWFCNDCWKDISGFIDKRIFFGAPSDG